MQSRRLSLYACNWAICVCIDLLGYEPCALIASNQRLTYISIFSLHGTHVHRHSHHHLIPSRVTSQSLTSKVRTGRSSCSVSRLLSKPRSYGHILMAPPYALSVPPPLLPMEPWSHLRRTLMSSRNGRRVKIWRNICLPNAFPILLLFEYGVFMTLRLCGMKLFVSILRKALTPRQTSEQSSWACSALSMAMSASSWTICVRRETS